MFIDGAQAYIVLDRCQDIFTDWVKEGDQFWNKETGEILTKDGNTYHDLVYRGTNGINISLSSISDAINTNYENAMDFIKECCKDVQ